MELTESKPKIVCRLCAGFTKGEHTQDPITCLPGRRKWYLTLTNEEQMDEIRKFEVVNPNLAEHVWDLSVARGVSPVEIMNSEALWLLV